MGDEFKKDLGAEIELVAGSNGVFDVSLDNTLIYSKFEKGRFPETEEILNLIKQEG